MKRFFKWVGIILGSFFGVLFLLIIGIVIYDKLTREDTNRNVEVVRTVPAPGGGKYELVIGRKLDNGKVVEWRIYRRNIGESGLPGFAIAAWDGDVPPKVDWWSATDANICIPVKEGIIRYQVAENLTTNSSPGGKFEANLNDFAFKVNHTCPAS